MSLEQWNTIFEIAGIVLLSLTVLSGTGALITANRINAKNKATTREISLALEEQKERTANAEIVQKRVETELAKQQERTAQAEVIQKRVETDLAVQTERTAKAERELIEIQERLRPRRLTMAQGQALVDELRTLPIKVRVPIDCINGDSEGTILAQQIRQILDAAGWPAGNVTVGMYSPPNPTGVLIKVKTRTPPLAAVIIAKALNRAGIECFLVENAGVLDETSLGITVGNKPE